jgi:hypothetical protein
MRLVGIHVYPVKGCRGVSPTRTDVVATGLAWDRSFLVVDEGGTFVSQREEPRLATIATTLAPPRLELRHERAGALAIDLDRDAAADREVQIWRDRCPAIDQGDRAAAFLARIFDRPLRLVRMDPTHHRQVGAAYPGRAATTFTDGYPILLTTQASLAELVEDLPTPVGMDRFRPNLVLDGAARRAELGWARLRIGDLELAVCKPCERCVVTTTDQRTGERSPREPLATLARRYGGVFGQNVVPLGRGELRVGDPAAAW